MFDEDAKIRQEIKRLSKQAKKLPLLFARLGDCYFRLGDPDRAELILRHGAEEHPDYIHGLLVLGEVNLYKNYMRDAEECVKQGLSRAPNHLGLLQLMVRIQKGLEEEHEARRLRSLLKTLDPLHLSEDLSEEEAQVFTQDEVGDDERPSGLASSASIWKLKAAARQQREMESDEEALETRSDPTPPTAEQTPSLEDYMKELTAPGSEISTLEAESGEGEPETRPFQKKIATKTLGELYARQNKFDEAIEIYQTLLESNPDNESYRARLEELNRKREIFTEYNKDLQNG